MLWNRDAGEDSWESIGLQGDQTRGNQPWIFIGRTEAEAEAPILWPPDANSWLIGKDPDAGKDWRWEKKGTTGWDSWMASLTQWTWVWANSRSWWWTGRPGVLWLMGSQKSWTWLSDWTELNFKQIFLRFELSCVYRKGVQRVESLTRVQISKFFGLKMERDIC